VEKRTEKNMEEVKKEMNTKIINSLRNNRDLIWIFTKREIEGKYKGSSLGILWSVINPIVMLCVYTIVFSKIFKAKWGVIDNDGIDDPVAFALNLFAGLIVFNIFAECAAKSTLLIRSNPNYVKKIVFPLEVLGLATTGCALFHGTVNLMILISVKFVLEGSIAPALIYLPILWGSYIITISGMVWILSILGVLIKDVNQIVNSVISVMMFMSPVFYPTEMVPIEMRWVANLNPLAYIINETRGIVIDGTIPSIDKLIVFAILSILIGEICLRLLKRKQCLLGDRL